METLLDLLVTVVGVTCMIAGFAGIVFLIGLGAYVALTAIPFFVWGLLGIALGASYLYTALR